MIWQQTTFDQCAESCYWLAHNGNGFHLLVLIFTRMLQIKLGCHGWSTRHTTTLEASTGLQFSHNNNTTASSNNPHAPPTPNQ